MVAGLDHHPLALRLVGFEHFLSPSTDEGWKRSTQAFASSCARSCPPASLLHLTDEFWTIWRVLREIWIKPPADGAAADGICAFRFRRVEQTAGNKRLRDIRRTARRGDEHQAKGSLMRVSCEVILVLHALTNWNLEGRCQGHVDTPLSEQGRRAALALAQRLANEQIDAIYSSDLRRARETAQELARLKGLRLQTDIRLREGRWASQEVTDEFPTLPFGVKVEGRDEVKSRMIDVMTEIARNHEGGRVVVVSHAGPVKQFVAHVRRLTEDSLPEFRAVRAAINRLTFRDGVWSCQVLDDAGHLPVLAQRNGSSFEL